MRLQVHLVPSGTRAKQTHSGELTELLWHALRRPATATTVVWRLGHEGKVYASCGAVHRLLHDSRGDEVLV